MLGFGQYSRYACPRRFSGFHASITSMCRLVTLFFFTVGTWKLLPVCILGHSNCLNGARPSAGLAPASCNPDLKPQCLLLSRILCLPFYLYLSSKSCIITQTTLQPSIKRRLLYHFNSLEWVQKPDGGNSLDSWSYCVPLLQSFSKWATTPRCARCMLRRWFETQKKGIVL